MVSSSLSAESNSHVNNIKINYEGHILTSVINRRCFPAEQTASEFPGFLGIPGRERARSRGAGREARAGPAGGAPAPLRSRSCSGRELRQARLHTQGPAPQPSSTAPLHSARPRSKARLHGPDAAQPRTAPAVPTPCLPADPALPPAPAPTRAVTSQR